MDQPEVVFLIGAAGSFFILFMVIGFLGFIFLYQRKIIQRQEKFNQIEKLLNQAEITATYRVLESISNERKKLAQEIHDHLGSLMAISAMLAESLSSKLVDEPLRNLAEKLTTSTKSALETTRRIAHEMDQNAESEGLKNAIELICESINSSQKMQVKAEIDIQGKIPKEKGVQVFRVLQELFNNALKHSSATMIQLHLSAFEGDYISLIFEDNGKGMQADQVQGLGIKGMKARLKKMNGEFTLESSPGKGTTVVIEIPLIEPRLGAD
jgi:two-component system, NarL family, sensor kinase